MCVDDLTHGHFAEYDDQMPEAERERRIVDAVVEFLGALFADRVAVWGQANVGGGWYRIDLGGSGGQPASRSSCGRGRGHKGMNQAPHLTGGHKGPAMPKRSSARRQVSLSVPEAGGCGRDRPRCIGPKHKTAPRPSLMKLF